MRLQTKLLGLGLLLTLILAVWAGDPSISEPLTPAVTTLVANSTNTTAGTPKMLYDGQSVIRLWVTASGTPATTNGSLVVRFSLASGNGLGAGVSTNEYDTGSLSNIKVTLTAIGSSTNTASDWFVPRGARFIRVSQIENTFQGSVSNLSVRIGYTKQ